MRKNGIWRAVVEVGFIVFLFYSNLLMGEIEHSAGGRNKGLLWDLQDIFAWRNLIVATGAAYIGYVVVERLRDGRPTCGVKNDARPLQQYRTWQEWSRRNSGLMNPYSETV